MKNNSKFKTTNSIWLLFYFILNLFYLFLAALGLRCCVRAFSSCGEWGLLLDAVVSHCSGFSLRWLLVAEHGL